MEWKLAVADEGASEVEPDDGREEMGIERSDDDTGELDPLNFGDSWSEEEEAGWEFWVADEDGCGRGEEGDNFGEGNDEEDACEGDEAAGPLEAFIFILTGIFNDGGIDFEGLNVHEMDLMFCVDGGAPDFYKAADDGGSEESD